MSIHFHLSCKQVAKDDYKISKASSRKPANDIINKYI